MKMKEDKKGDRIYGDKISLSDDSVSKFFEERADKYDPENPLVSVIYQDHNPKLAEERDEYEKEKLLPLMGLTESSSVLDIGCGIGRWAEAVAPTVQSYHGTDFTAQFIDLAKDRLSNVKNATFQVLPAHEAVPGKLDVKAPFDTVLIVGLFPYLNDSQFHKVIHNLIELSAENSTILLREPIGSEKRLSLNEIWSEDLNTTYSAIYRSLDEFVSVFQTLEPHGITLEEHGPLYPDKLRNRVDTHHHYFLLKRHS